LSAASTSMNWLPPLLGPASTFSISGWSAAPIV
jgi:hypothetical protein